jgi:hypothetical protein
MTLAAKSAGALDEPRVGAAPNADREVAVRGRVPAREPS